MHKIARPDVGPSCLARYRHGQHRWRDLTTDERGEIWEYLDAMQGKRCAYCEVGLKHPKRHIEHFEKRDNAPQLTFAWNNLFGSCNRQATCGNHKDRCHHNTADLIKPDRDNPDDYLLFSYNGDVTSCPGLTATQKKRAEETIRVFNLNNSTNLVPMRRQAARNYRKTVEALLELAKECDRDEVEQLFQDELSAICGLPFTSTLRHLLQG